MSPVVIDARGRRCPLPILDLARRIGDVAVGETITVEADDPAARPDVQAWCRMRGHAYVGEHEAHDGTPGYTVRRLRWPSRDTGPRVWNPRFSLVQR